MYTIVRYVIDETLAYEDENETISFPKYELESSILCGIACKQSKYKTLQSQIIKLLNVIVSYLMF